MLKRSEIYKKMICWFGIKNVSVNKDYFSWYGSIKQSDLPEGARLVKKNNLGKTKDCMGAYDNMAIQANGKVEEAICLGTLFH